MIGALGPLLNPRSDRESITRSSAGRNSGETPLERLGRVAAGRHDRAAGSSRPEDPMEAGG